MLTIVAFLVALGLLIAVHEYGHYRVAVACGVKVLRFSVGFGKPLLRWAVLYACLTNGRPRCPPRSVIWLSTPSRCVRGR